MTNRVGVIGDTHGNQRWSTYAIRKFEREKINTVMHVGDFGIWPRGDAFLNWVQTNLAKAGQIWKITPGNHEDYDQIEAVPVDADGWQRIRPNIWIAPRGLRWKEGSASFVSLGGAPSVDRYGRLNAMNIVPPPIPGYEERVNIDRVPKLKRVWWPQEAITPEDVRRTIDGGPADVMIGHDAPIGVQTVQEHIQDNPFGFKQWDLDYAYEGRKLYTEAVVGVKPELLFHGHYHIPVDEIIQLGSSISSGGWETSDIRTCRVIGLANEYQNHALGYIDTETLDAATWELDEDFRQYEDSRWHFG